MFTREFIKETILLSPLAVLFSPEEIEEVVDDIYRRYSQQQTQTDIKQASTTEGELT